MEGRVPERTVGTIQTNRPVHVERFYPQLTVTDRTSKRFTIEAITASTEEFCHVMLVVITTPVANTVGFPLFFRNSVLNANPIGCQQPMIRVRETHNH